MKKSLLVLSMLAAGCATGGLSDSELLGQPKVVREAPGLTAGDGSVLSEDEASRRLDAARQAFGRGEYDESLRICRTALEEGVPYQIATEFRSLRFEVRKRLLEKEVVHCRVLPERDLVVVGEEAVFELATRNVSESPIRIPDKGPGSTGTVFVIDIERQDWDIFGNVRSEKNRVLVPLTGILDIPVGGRRSLRESVPTETPGGRHLGFTILRISGVLRPAVIVSGEERYYQGVEVEEGILRIVPPGYEPIAADPVGTLSKAWRLGAREHLLLAAELAPPEKKEEVIGMLVGYLGEPDRVGSATTITVMAALRRLTGMSFANRAQAWMTWWEEVRPE
jgi:hypothetical protein